MGALTLLRRSLAHYWRAHVAVVLGVAAAAAALGGSLVVGDSVRGSLADTALARLGNADYAVESPRFFRADLAADLASRPAFAASFGAACPILALRGVATHQASRRHAGDVLVYGVDERFWSFQGLAPPAAFGSRDAWLSEALAAELESQPGDALLVRLQAADDISGGTLFGRRDDPARGLRVSVRGALSRERLGELSLQPRAGAVRAVFVPLDALARAVGRAGSANVVLVSARRPTLSDAGLAAALGDVLGEAARLDDLGLRLRPLAAQGVLQLETTSALVDDDVARAAHDVAARLGFRVSEALVYLANSIRAGSREVPYSLVAALDTEALRAVAGRQLEAAAGEPPPIVLDDWAASDLQVAPGAPVRLDYYLWREQGRLVSESAELSLAAVTPMTGLAADRELVPDYPGITESVHVSDWDPPFPVDLSRIRPKDEEYWDRHGATPKAFVALELGQRLWGQRQGRLTSLRLRPPADAGLEEARERFAAALRAVLLQRDDAGAARGLRVVPVKQAGLGAARGSTDFGEYFVYFSFFLVAAALLLAGLFFRLGLEQRLREVGLLEALGFSAARLRAQFLGEGLLLAGLGGALGSAAAAGYAGLVLWGLRTQWSDSLGTRDLALHLEAGSLLAGAFGAVAAAALAIAFTLRDLRRLSPRSLLAGSLEAWGGPARRRRLGLPAALLAAALALAAASGAGAVSQTAGFFGAGALLLAAALVAVRRLVSGRPGAAAALAGVAGLGFRGVSFRPGRSVACVALVASASFVIVAVGAFRHAGAEQDLARDGESGGYRLLAWSLVPLHHDPASPEGQAALGLDADALRGVTVARFRARLGEDASCLNLYEPRQPTVLAPENAFLREGRFRFQSSLAETPAERANPWLLLEGSRGADGAVPVVADASSLQYILHRKLGDVMELGETGVRVRFVGALAPGLFQAELLMGERHFQEAFPEESGFRFFLLEADAARAAAAGAKLESALADFGFDASDTASRLRDFHRVENTYIATFQALGALGLLLGSVGLATVLVRNALEQRRELALLRAVGYRPRDVARMALAENALLLGLGLASGALPALLAIAPVLLLRQGALPLATLSALVVGVAATGALASWLAVSVIQRLPLVASLRSE